MPVFAEMQQPMCRFMQVRQGLSLPGQGSMGDMVCLLQSLLLSLSYPSQKHKCVQGEVVLYFLLMRNIP
jgi:hypothetical protein